MQTKYANMHAMLKTNNEAWQFFSGLPDYVRDHISSREGNVTTLASLKNYADNLLRGDI